jgi:hypothetical protein
MVVFDVNPKTHACRCCGKRYIDKPNDFPMEHRVDHRRIQSEAFTRKMKQVEHLKGPRLMKICYDCVKEYKDDN